MELAALFLGLFFFTFLEYWHHRSGGHVGSWGKRVLTSHQDHHKDYMDGGTNLLQHYLYRLPTVIIFLIPISGISVLIAGNKFGGLYTLGVYLGYLYSEYIHYSIHHRKPRNTYERNLWKHHGVHHFKNGRKNFGFSLDLWDRVFGTKYGYVSDEVRSVRSGD